MRVFLMTVLALLTACQGYRLEQSLRGIVYGEVSGVQDRISRRLDALVSRLNKQCSESQSQPITTSTSSNRFPACDPEGKGPGQQFDVFGDGRKYYLAFRATAGVGRSAYDDYVNITDNVRPEPGCRQVSSSLPCSVHYRNNPILDCWQNIDEVVVALYDSGVLKQSLTFDAAGTDYLSWFSPKKLKDAGNWKDLKGLSTNYFSIPGYVRVKRNFYINHKFGGCGGDIGWLLVVDQANAKCGYEKFKTFPQFLYNSRDTRMNFKSKFRALADVMAVFVKYRSSPRAY